VLVYGKGLSAEALKELVHLSDVTGAKIVGTKGGANSLAASQFGLNSLVKLNGHQVVYAALGSEDPSQHIIQLLEKAPFLVVHAAFSSALSARADVVLPSQSWLEQEGTYVNFEGKIQKGFKTLTGPEGTKPDEEIFTDLASTFNIKLDTDWKKSLKERVAPVVIQG
jgi:predicted molibdopterin-dependent oxidoreductase YjgC